MSEDDFRKLYSEVLVNKAILYLFIALYVTNITDSVLAAGMMILCAAVSFFHSVYVR